ncbi:unnamed protein product [Caenorhabditis nigoni]
MDVAMKELSRLRCELRGHPFFDLIVVSGLFLIQRVLHQGLLAALILASLVVVSIIVSLVGLGIFHHTDITSCHPLDYPQTFLFAYSNDLLPETVLDSWNTFFRTRDGYKQYSWIGTVRFDTENMNIPFHRSEKDINATILNNLPDPKLGFQNSKIGSNVFDAIKKFFSNTQAPVCGSRIIVLLERFPNEADISQLVSLIRSHHAVVSVITSSTPSGGTQPKSMYSVASKTNGMGAFEHEVNFKDAIWWFPIYDFPYPVYATTIQVSGSGTKILPDFYPPTLSLLKIDITYQDHVPDGSFLKHNLRWTNPGDSGNLSFDSSECDGTYVGKWATFHHTMEKYTMELDYNYSGQDVQNLQIRFYSQIGPNNWLPYSD